jgi:hypothetical protein
MQIDSESHFQDSISSVIEGGQEGLLGGVFGHAEVGLDAPDASMCAVDR